MKVTVIEIFLNWLKDNESVFGALASIIAIGSLVVFFISYLVKHPFKQVAKLAETAAKKVKDENGIPAIGVLPLNAFSDDPNHAHLADGMTEDIITLLSRFDGFRVIARNSTFAYKGQHPDIRDVGATLGARYIVEGSLRKAGSKMRTTVQLIETAGGTHVWAASYDQQCDDCAETLDEITNAIVSSLQPELYRAEWDRVRLRPAADLNTHQLILRAFAPLYVGFKHNVSTRESEALMRLALTREPENAKANAVLAWALGNQSLSSKYGGGNGDHTALLEEAKALGRKAIGLARHDTLVMYCWAAVLTYSGDREPAIDILAEVLERDPNNAQVMAFMGNVMARNGQVTEGQRHIERAIELSPTDSRLYLWCGYLAWTMLLGNDLDGAYRFARRGIRLHDRFFLGWFSLALAAAGLGRDADVRRAMRNVNEIDASFSLSRYHDYAGQLAEHVEPVLPLLTAAERVVGGTAIRLAASNE
ncbi:MAG: tetratricopeptide repeat protein [Pseudomonadota bacterium]